MVPNSIIEVGTTWCILLDNEQGYGVQRRTLHKLVLISQGR